MKSLPEPIVSRYPRSSRSLHIPMNTTSSPAAAAPTARTPVTVTIARILMGILFLAFGLDGFIHYMPHPATPPPAAAMDWATAIMKTGYLWQLLKGTEAVVGALLLMNRFVPLALAVIAP